MRFITADDITTQNVERIIELIFINAITYTEVHAILWEDNQREKIKEINKILVQLMEKEEILL